MVQRFFRVVGICVFRGRFCYFWREGAATHNYGILTVPASTALRFAHGWPMVMGRSAPERREPFTLGFCQHGGCGILRGLFPIPGPACGWHSVGLSISAPPMPRDHVPHEQFRLVFLCWRLGAIVGTPVPQTNSHHIRSDLRFCVAHRQPRSTFLGLIGAQLVR